MAREADLKARIQLVGGEDFRKQLTQLGSRGERAFQALDGAAKDSRKALRRIDGAVAQVRKRLKQAGRGAASLASGIAKVSSKAALLGGAAITGAAAGVFKLAQRSAEAADKLGKMSQQVGVSASTLSELRFAAEQSGATTKDLDDSIRRFNRRLGIFTSEGAGPAASAFEDLGIKTRDASGELRSSEAVLDDVFRELGKIESEAELAGRASRLFGETAGPKLVPLLKQGEEGIADLRGEARALGLNFTEDQTKASAAFNDALNRVKNAFTGVTNQIGQVFLPKLTELAERLATFISGNREAIVAWVEKGWKFVTTAVQDFAALFTSGGQADVVFGWTRSAFNAFGDVKDAIKSLLPTAERVFEFVREGLRRISNAIDNAKRILGAFKERGVFGGTAQLAFELTRERPNRPAIRAEGGPVRGPGTGTSDSIPARLSNGEYVLRAASVQSLGERFLDRLNSFGASALRRPAFAEGGIVETGGGGAEAAGASTNFDFSGSTIVAPDPERFIDQLNRYVDAGGAKRLRTNAVAPRAVRR